MVDRDYFDFAVSIAQLVYVRGWKRVIRYGADQAVLRAETPATLAK